MLIVGVALAAAGTYLVLMKGPAGEVQPENVPPGVVTKSGVLLQDETWSGEIFVSGVVEVPENVTLTIEPGTVVKFKHSRDYKNPHKGGLHIRGGVLRAIGTPEKPIWFTSEALEPINGDWDSIFISDSKHNNVIKYSIVEYAQIGITFWTSSGTVANSIVRWILAEGIYMERSNPVIENNTIYGTGFNGIAMEQFNENVIIRYNRVENNQCAGIHGEATKATVESNTVRNGRFGITFNDLSEVVVRNNLVENQSVVGLDISVKTRGTLSSNEIRNNKVGITTYDSWLTAHGNDIYNNELALDAYSMQQLDVKNNWWGTVDSARVRENIQSDQEVTYEPFLTNGVVDIPELVFDYRDGTNIKIYCLYLQVI